MSGSGVLKPSKGGRGAGARVMCILSSYVVQHWNRKTLQPKPGSLRKDAKEGKYFPLPSAKGSSGTEPEGIWVLDYRFIF